MKKSCFFIFVSLLSAIFVLQSCEKENQEPPQYGYAIGTLLKNQGGHYYLHTDHQKKILLADSILIHQTGSKATDRVLASFFILDQKNNEYDYVATLFDLYKILTKPILKLTPEMADSIGNDRVDITNMWVYKDLLNVEFRFSGSGQVTHLINLVVSQTGDITEDGYANLQFRHNKEGDKELKMYRGLISFKLADFAPQTGKVKGVKVSVNTYKEGEKTQTLDYSSHMDNAPILKGEQGYQGALLK